MYIERPADRDLYDRLSHGDDCLVLSPPKTGKSFLLERMRSRLENDGVKCVSLRMSRNQQDNPRTSISTELYWEFIHDLATQFTMTTILILAAQSQKWLKPVVNMYGNNPIR